MKRILLVITLASLLSPVAGRSQSRFVTLFTTTNSLNVLSLLQRTNETGLILLDWLDGKLLVLNTNETGRIVDGSLDGKNSLNIYKNGQEIYSQAAEGTGRTPTHMRSVTIAGPATFALVSGSNYAKSHCTIEVIPNTTSFASDKTLILPEGMVGIVRVESSTNLIQWQTEWIRTFANTNQTRLLRIRAERSLQ